jgi:hypothetical protein
MGDENVAKALANPNEEFGKYDGVIYSPTVQSGISYDQVNVINSIYGIFGNGSNSSEDVCQMLHRVRHPISNTITVAITEYNHGKHKATSANAIMSMLKNSRKHLLNGTQEKDILDIINRVPFEYNNFGQAEFVESEQLHEYAVNRAEHNLDSILFKQNFIGHQMAYGNVMETAKIDEKADSKTKLELTKSLAEVNLGHATELSLAQDIVESEADLIRKQLRETPDQVTKTEIDELKKYNVIKHYNLDSAPKSPAWFLKYTQQKYKNHYYQQSKYFKKTQSLELSLIDVKHRECVADTFMRLGNDNGGVSTDQGIVNSILSKPTYQKHKILIGFITQLGFTGLNCDNEIDQADLQINLALAINSCDEHMFEVLGKQKKGLEQINQLKVTDTLFVKNGLNFINGSLKSEFGVSVKKKSKNSSNYKLFNAYLDNNEFTMSPARVNPIKSLADINPMSPARVNPIKSLADTPVLGKTNATDMHNERSDRFYAGIETDTDCSEGEEL